MGSPRRRTSSLRRATLLIAVVLLSGGCTSSDPDDEPAPSSGPTPSTATSAHSPQRCADCLSVVVTGDLLVHPQLWDQAAADAAVTGRDPLDFEPLLASQRPYLATADLGICHLETPVAEPEGPFSGYPRFNVPPQILAAAVEVGYDTCTSASNHSIDAGTAGLLRTLAALDAAGLEHTGSYATEDDADEVLVINQPEARVALIEGTYGLNGLVPDQPWRVDMIDVPAMIAKARAARAEGADIVLAALHAGDEYAIAPNSLQVESAHALADSGDFDFIYGHHAHAVQPIEKYNGTWIVYGLGNAVTELSPLYDVNNEGLMVRASFSRNDEGTWSVSELLWLPSLIVAAPYRWCALSPDQPGSGCSSPERDAAAAERTRSVVESLGAREAGARRWTIPSAVAGY
ncbi:hypothetical protein RCH21_001159 [Arthrobacter sp. PL16]|uniref:CapA family protein n=1 Tax=Arthrobacter sp. PL16 TaxID=3071720 RepID=UPI002DFEE433|nr:hypothetical protein [Arthrobacter sp. PL16]